MTRLLMDPTASCAWGEHDHPEKAALERHDPDRGWVPTCLRHLTARRSQPTPRYGRCPLCGGSAQIRQDGTWGRHRAPVPPGAGIVARRPCWASGTLVLVLAAENSTVHVGESGAGADPTAFKIQMTTGAGASTPTPVWPTPIRETGSEQVVMQRSCLLGVDPAGSPREGVRA